MADGAIDFNISNTNYLDPIEKYCKSAPNTVLSPDDMSKQKEHISSDIEMSNQTEKEESIENHSKSVEVMAMAHSETPMLEDEEMPTYISVSTSSKCEDSDISNAKHHEEESPTKEQSRSPCTSEREGPASVYVLSSEEETNYEEYYRDYGERDYGDSDDMDDIENDNDNGMLDDDDEDEVENVPEYGYNDEEYDDNWLETASDCLGIKSKLKKRYRDKSLSLQDLTIFQNNACDSELGKRNRYKHIESKVKNYINDIKEQNKFSSQRRLQDQQAFTGEHIKDRNCADGTGIDVEQIKDIKTNKVIKDYAERAIKDLEIEESYTNKNLYMAPITENGEAEEEEEEEVVIDKHKQDTKSAAIDMGDKEFLTSGKKNGKRNGSVQINILNHNYNQFPVQKNLKFTDEQPLVNGHRRQLSLFNLRSLSYDEYMQNNTNVTQDEQLNKDMNIEQNENNDIQAYGDVDVINTIETDNSNAACSLKIENVKSIRVMNEESKDNTETKLEKINEDTGKSNLEIMQITLLKNQLDQKTIQFNNLRNAYQNTLAENLKMKQELEELKMSLTKYNKENRTCETKVVAVQTDVAIITESVIENKEITDIKENSNKISGSSITSALSSINQWTDSAGSSGISIKPPDLGTVLNSEDSLVMTDDTPRKINRPLSRAFVTSSRILQTLSNITQGKSKSDIRSTSNNSNNRSVKRPSGSDESETVKENDGSIIAGSNTFTIKSPLNTKKRKATEMLGNSIFLQPLKIPHTAEIKKKSSTTTSDFNIDFKSPDNYSDTKLDTQKNRISNISRSASPTTVENKNDKTEDIENEESNVKCFVYQEDENIDDRSILIQAEIPNNNDQEATNMNCIRECGPYLLGNVEVRMSEVNGTINIWGKEISETSIAEKEEDLEVSTKSPYINKKCTCLQNTVTPHRKFNGSQMVCSTNKKVKLPPKCNEGHTSHQYLNVPTRSDEKVYVDNLLSPSGSAASCEKCILLNQQKECSIHKRHINLHEKSHSCCLHHIEHLERDYKYVCDCERLKHNNDSPNCVKEGFCTEKKFPFRNTPNSRKDLYEYINPTVDAKEVICKHRTTCRRSSLHNTEANFQNDMKCCNTIRETSHTCKSTLGCMGNHDSGVEHFCNHSPIGNNDDLLIPERSSCETPEIRQRRSSGKKVRGILMDLLKSCGDHRNGSTSSSKRCSNGKEASNSVNSSPLNNVTSCNSPNAACSNLQQSNGRCCHAYTRRIESQLEEFRMEMERVRSRSDAILNLLNMLHSVEMN
ncbi:uncharacterized protein DDB_G0283697-like isoform X1 [Vespa crabro]|uniref:uncharacterized protein DDB_G0283697-like isoform X1 n=2 Tax=Vespa crabro TaxID=7445 RepID=UPI001F002D8F|nr:uncharacterized protein DDB_G0283697-like isoform X1 [Vespa crabro]